MTNKLKQTIKEEVGKLKKENQEVINAFGWENIAEEIGKKNLLTESEINDLQVETLLVLVGLQDPEEYAQNVENNIGTSKNEAEKITNEIFQKIFTPINNILLEKIKKSDKVKNATAEQNLNFILSGGNYAAFLDAREEVLNSPHPNPLLKGEGEDTETVLPVFSIKK